MTLIAEAFPKLWTQKSVVRYVSKTSGFSGPFDRQHSKQAETLSQSERQHRYHI